MPLSVTTLIPCYNRARFVHKTVQSALSQTYSNNKVVVIDDASNDGTSGIITEFKNQCTLMRNITNIGAAASLNRGIQYTQSDLIAFLDSDDLWYPEKLESQVSVFEKYSDVGAVYTNGHAIDEYDNILYTLFPSNHEERNDFGRILTDCYISAGSSTFVVRRDAIKKVGLFDERYRCSYDHDMWIRLSEITSFYYLDKTLMAYRFHGKQLSQSRLQWELGFQILDNALKRRPEYLKFRNRRRAVLYYRLGVYDFSQGKYLASAASIIRAVMNDFRRFLKIVTSKAGWTKIAKEI